MMTEPKVILKKVKMFRGMEGYGLNADVYINGVKCLLAIDDGNGGCMDYERYANTEAVKANIKLLEDYIASLPPKEVKLDFSVGGKPFNIKVDMDIFINDILAKMEDEKFDAKRTKMYDKAICYGVPNGKQYRIASWKNKTLAQIDKINLQRAYNDVKAKLGKGEVILNTNLVALGINL